MSFLASALAWLFGKGLKAFTVPALVIGLVVTLHQIVKGREERAAIAATNVCDARWEAAIRHQEREQSARREQATIRAWESERRTNEQLREEIEAVRSEADALRARAGTDGRCLSDGVLDALRKKR